MHFVFFTFQRIDLSDYYLRLALAFLTFNHGYGTGSGGIWGKEFSRRLPSAMTGTAISTYFQR